MPARLGIMPFDVPENFAQPGNDALHFGKDLASRFQLELSRAGEIQVVELFDQNRWSGKREDFKNGNYGAIIRAHRAGYDFVMVGYLEDIVDDRTLNLNTKIIDTSNFVTIWSARTTVDSNARQKRRLYHAANVGPFKIGTYNDSLFDFPERTEKVVVCTVKSIVSDDPLEVGEDIYPGKASLAR